MADQARTGSIWRFEVSRTSSRKAKPCDEAIRGSLPQWDVRTFKSPEEHDSRFSQPGQRWHDQGTDHQFVYGPRGGVQGIKRRMGEQETWLVEFSDLAGLMAFYEKYGDLVIDTSWIDKQTPRIEIYDDYRE